MVSVQPGYEIPPITAIAVSGFKSIGKRRTIEIRPLTLLAGANSSGKSSIMQPLLLWKQSLEATYDPGPLLLNGPNVRFTSFEQLLSRHIQGSHPLEIGVVDGTNTATTVSYTRAADDIAILEMRIVFPDGQDVIIRSSMSDEEIRHQRYLAQEAKRTDARSPGGKRKQEWRITRERCFLDLSLVSGTPATGTDTTWVIFGSRPSTSIMQVIHISGLRGNPQRTYPVTAVGDTFSGTFENYAASVVADWQKRQTESLDHLAGSLNTLGLASKIVASRIDDAQVEIKVGRRPRHGHASDLVSIADVGFGVSQALPVVVALLAARPGQLVFVEQPEIHLHPRAQTALAVVLADAARRGVRVVVETHSSLLLLGVQTLVAEGKLDPALIKLHWFHHDSDGETQIRSADLDPSGAFGEDWPEDFGEVTLEAESRYLDAQEARRSGGTRE